MFAQAINSTRLAIPINRCSFDPYHSCIAWMPAPPGVSTTWTFFSNVLPCSDENVSSVASACRSRAVTFSCRGAIATPGLMRPTM